MIFVQIAAYRDPQLLPTIYSCLMKADNPKRINFGVVEQTLPDDPIVNFPQQCKHRRIHVADCKGVCYARHLANQFYDREDYYLQIDSHTRFDQGWDTALIKQLNETTKPNPVFTMYPSGWHLDPAGKDVIEHNASNVTICSGFRADGSVILEPRGMPEKRAMNARFLAGGFIFTTGDFVENVKDDPRIYWIGEELLLSVQAFTHGYDILNPAYCPIYHFYTRTGAPRVWDNVPNWHAGNATSLQLVNHCLTEDYAYFGNLRTVPEYEEYSGLNFKARTLTDAVQTGKEPPDIRTFPRIW